MNFSNLADTEEFHWLGSLITFNKKLTIIAGWLTVNVRVLETATETWNASRIHATPDDFKTRIKLYALVVTESDTDTLFIFGKLLLFSQVC